MPTRAIILPLVAAILILYAFVTGGAIPKWSVIQRTAGILGSFLLLWDYYLWRIPWLYPKVVALPDLRGTWAAHATIFYLPPQSGTGTVTVEYEETDGYVIIRQTGTGIKVSALWDDERYTSTMRRLAPATADDGRGVFVGQYEDKQGVLVGVAGIDIYNRAHPDEAVLYYATIENIPQRGHIVLRSRIRQLCTTRQEARALFTTAKTKLTKRLQFFLWPT